MTTQTALKGVDGVEIVSLADNTVDFLSTNMKKEAKQVREWVKERMGEELQRSIFDFHSLNMVFQH